MSEQRNQRGIAIIGMGCRFPRAENLNECWDLLANGQTAFEPIPPARNARHSVSDLEGMIGSFLEHPFLFDNRHFNLPESEALYLDPQQRIMLELAVEVMEDGAFTSLANQKTGVFIGANQMAYEEMITSRWYRQKALEFLTELEAYQQLPEAWRLPLQTEIAGLLQQEPLPPHALVGNLINMIAGRIAHELNLKGPALTIDTACSSSLVAVHLACQALSDHSCDLAFAGGINLNLSPSIFRYMKAAGVISPSGRSIPFSQKSDGILLGEGAGMVLLKRLEDAERDHDPIRAVIRGSGINNDGRSLSIMAPGWKGQLALLENTYQQAGFDPARISALEAHGTSTRIGDAVELSVIERFFPRTPANPIAVGSMKSNIGHTLGAAGIAGLIKMALAIGRRQIPPSIHETPDPDRQLDKKGILIPSSLINWESAGLRAAGVSSFGFGGTNAHVILEEHPGYVAERPAPRTVFQRQYFNFDFFPQLQPAHQTHCRLVWESAGDFKPEAVPAVDHWLLLGWEADQLAQWQQVAAQFSKSAFQAHLTNTPHFLRLSEEAFGIHPAASEHVRWLLDALPAQATLGVVLIGRKTLAEDHEVFQALQLFRSLLQVAKQRSQTRLWIVTNNAFQVLENELPRPDQRALATLAFGALAEQEGVRGGVLDFSEQENTTPDQCFAAISSEWPAPMVLRRQQLFLPQLQVESTTNLPKLKPAGVYIIIGGSSGIGAEVADFLLNNGARKVLVTGTRSLEELPQNLQNRGASLVYQSCSVLNKTALKEVLDHWLEQYPEVDGLLFAAGVVHYGALATSSEIDFERTLRTKIEGVQHLRDCLQDKVVKTVYLMSSIAALSPQWAKGMADYAAANAYLEAFAAAQNQGQQRWVACSWGVWENTGMAARVTAAAKHGLPLEEALETFGATWAFEHPYQAVLLPADRSDFTFRFPAKTAVPPPAKVAERPQEPPVQENRAFPVNDDGYIPLLKRLVAEVLGRPDTEVDEKTSIYQFGLDSLSAVEVVFNIEKATGFSLDPTLLFEYDTIESLGAYLNQRGSKDLPPSQAPTHEATENTDAFSLLPAQKTFFAQQTMFPEAPCNMLVTAEFNQTFKPEWLQTVWSEIVRQEEALRMAYFMTDGGPQQQLKPHVNSVVEWRQADDLAGARRLEDELVHAIFDLEEPPLFRLVCVATSAGQTALMLLLHHLVADAWSMQVLLEKLLSGYRQMEQHQPLSWSAPGVSFSKYEQFVRQKQQNNDYGKLQAYWKAVLAEAKTGIALPYRSVLKETGQYHTVFESLSTELTRQVLESAAQWQVTPFHVLLAAYFITLGKHSRQHDLMTRIAVANRDQSFPGVEHLIGCLADTLPLRVILRDGMGLDEAALLVKQHMIEALRHSGLSSQELVSLASGRSAAAPKVLSPAGISFLPMDYLEKDTGLALVSVRGRSALNFTDISLICALTAEQLSFSWNYSDQKFEPAVVQEMHDSMVDVLKNGVYPRPSCTALPLEMPSANLFPEQALLHEKVWAACRQFAAQPAVAFESEVLTYEQLRIDSVAIANTLRLRFPHLEVAGILAYPGIPAVKGMLGVLGAGMAFVPFDPDWPDGRMEMMLAHAGLKVMLTTTTHLPRLLENHTIMAMLEQVLVLDTSSMQAHWPPEKIAVVADTPSAEKVPARRPVTPQSLAYVMYTSGTSGQPKGVMVRHEAVEVFLNWVSEAFQLDQKTRFVHTSSLGFGGSIRQVFSTLLAGGVIYPVDRPVLKDPQAFLEFLAEHRITMLNTVPTVLNNLLEWLSQDGAKTPDLSELKWVLVGGETLFSATVEKWYKRFGSAATMVNLYGSTETIVNATMYPIPPGSSLPAGAVPLGRQKKGSVVRVLNERGETCQAGETGEIYVGGPCLAAGYYQEPALTSQKFVYLSTEGSVGLFYRTGDLGRFDENGLLHFLGRNDDQIQVYGNRVEPVEIEEVLFQTQAVKNAAVVDYKIGATHWLVAFVELLKTGTPVPEKALREFVAARLPAYMMPHRVVVLDKMPLNHAGKTDRAALRKRLESEYQNPEAVAAPTATEGLLATIWQKVLHQSDIARDSDFFELGGDSILLLEVLFQLRKHFNQVPKAAAFFRLRKLHELATELDNLNSRPVQEKQVVEAEPQAATLLSPAQKGFILIRDLQPDRSPNWSAMLQLEGELDLPLLEKAFNLLLQRHDMLRTVFVGRGGNVRPQVLAVEPQVIAVEDLSAWPASAQEERLKQVFEDLKTIRFDLERFPLFHLALYKKDSGHWVLAVCLHHIAGDAWSMHVLFDELQQAYEAFKSGRAPDLGPPPPSYQTATAYWLSQASTINAARARVLTDFWSRTLASLPVIPPFELATESVQVSLLLPVETKACLIQLARENGVSLYNVLFAIFARTLKNGVQSDDLLLGTAVSGREIPIGRVQKIVGCFAKNLPVRIKLPAAASWEQDLKTVETAFLEAYEHQEIAPSELFKIISKAGNQSIFSINRYYFSFMDFTAMDPFKGRYLNILWDQSDYFFNAGDAGSELMLGVSVAEQIRIQIHGAAARAVKQQFADHFQAEIDALTTSGGPLDVALVAYMPGASWLRRLLPDTVPDSLLPAVKSQLFPKLQPRLIESTKTAFGVGGMVMLPSDADALQAMTFPVLVRQVSDAVGEAVRQGARVVSLAGVLPALTNYGNAVFQEIQKQPWYHPGIRLTTGHSTTVVAVVKTIEKVLAAVSADLGSLTVAVVGYGSIGQSSLRLLLRALGMPRAVVIADLKAQLPKLEHPIEVLRQNYAGTVTVCPVGAGESLQAIYEADLVIGASTGGSVLEAGRFKPGAILVDDSFPPVVDQASAIQRMTRQRDVLLLGGGKLSLGDQLRSMADWEAPPMLLEALLRSVGDVGMPGCRVEPFVLSKYPELNPTLGLASPEQVWQYWLKTTEMGIFAVPLHLGGFVVPDALLEAVGAVIRQSNSSRS